MKNSDDSHDDFERFRAERLRSAPSRRPVDSRLPLDAFERFRAERLRQQDEEPELGPEEVREAAMDGLFFGTSSTERRRATARLRDARDGSDPTEASRPPRRRPPPPRPRRRRHATPPHGTDLRKRGDDGRCAG